MAITEKPLAHNRRAKVADCRALAQVLKTMLTDAKEKAEADFSFSKRMAQDHAWSEPDRNQAAQDMCSIEDALTNLGGVIESLDDVLGASAITDRPEAA